MKSLAVSICFLLMFLHVGDQEPRQESKKEKPANQKPANQEQESQKQEKRKVNDDPLAHVKKKGKPNGLIDETSPYLLMHAYNPVQWRPWNAETLKLAIKEDKPIFLSIGYSSCHWCHVMERESFMDREIAEFLNKNFICIKVDREERPDVDNIYMTSLSIYIRESRSGGGTGWPLSMFLTPDAKPFSAGLIFLPVTATAEPASDS